MIYIRFLGNACIEIIGNHDHFIIDPVFLSTPKKGIEKIFITHHHQDHVTQDKLTEVLTNFSMIDKEPEIYGPECVYEDLNIDFTLIQPNSRIDLNDGYIQVFENKCWKAEGCIAYFIILEGKKLLHTADSAEFSDKLRSISSEIDLCFLACFESNFKDYLEFIKTIPVKQVIPYHFNQEKVEEGRKFNEFLQDNNINSKFLAIGGEIVL